MLSNEYMTAIKGQTRQFVLKVVIDGKEITGITNCEIKDTFNADENLSLGGACSKRLTLEFYNPSKEKTFDKIVVTSGLVLEDGSVEFVEMGVFYTENVKSRNEWASVRIIAYDAMLKLHKPYKPTVSLPTTDTLIIQDICNQTGVEFVGTTLDCEIKQIFADTMRNTIGYMAGLQGFSSYITIDDKLDFKFNIEPVKWGEVNKKWNELEEISWVNLMRRSDTKDDAKDFVITPKLQYLDGFLKNSEEIIRINSVTSGTEEDIYTYGTGKGISFENPYITPEQVNKIGERLVGYEYLPCEIKWRGNPTIRSGTAVTAIDRAGKEYNVLICNQTLKLTGGFSCVFTSLHFGDVIVFDNLSPMETKLRRSYTKLHTAIVEASELINGAKGGIFQVTDSDDDGVNDGWILAEKPNIDNNTKCIVGNYEGIGLSKNGGATYENAITHNGIVANSITAGQIIGGNVVFDLETGKLRSISNDGSSMVELGGETGYSIYKKSNGNWQKSGGITPNGRTFTQSISNLEDSSWYAEMGVTGTGEQQGLTLTSATTPKYLQITESSGSVLFLDKNDTTRISLGTNGTILTDQNDKDRFYADNNITVLTDQNGNTRFYADSDETRLMFGNNTIGIDANGAFKIVNGVGVYI